MASPSCNEIVSYSFLHKLVASEVADIISGIEQRFSYLIEGDHGIGKSAFWKDLCIEYDGFIRTTDLYHEKEVKNILTELYKKKIIYKGFYESL